jgi:hypothetical protein
MDREGAAAWCGVGLILSQILGYLSGTEVSAAAIWAGLSCLGVKLLNGRKPPP